MRITIIALSILMLAPAMASADGKSWLTKENPDELTILAMVHPSCGIDQDSFEETINGILIRSRIKPVRDWKANTLALHVSLFCLEESRRSNVYSLDVSFVYPNINADDDFIVTKTFASQYGSLGEGNKKDMLASIRGGVEHAVTVYLKANFDLGDDE